MYRFSAAIQRKPMPPRRLEPNQRQTETRPPSNSQSVSIEKIDNQDLLTILNSGDTEKLEGLHGTMLFYSPSKTDDLYGGHTMILNYNKENPPKTRINSRKVEL